MRHLIALIKYEKGRTHTEEVITYLRLLSTDPIEEKEQTGLM